jgi:hypothetical protein|tara:strand:- start:691 stop:1191 length:501 start_codon:yes stop_codon:yes gene_type:complete
MENTENLDKALLAFGDRIIDEMQNQLFENKSVNTGDLARSITKNIVNNNDTETLQVSLLWYGELLEDGGPGRRAGRMPPILPIEGWIRRKNIPVPSKFKSPKSFAFAIAKSIKKKGVKKYSKKPFIMESINNAAANFGDEAIAAGVEADLIIDINKAFIESGAIIT